MERIIGDRFVLERQVGAGGMGEVFRARDKLTGGPVAIKVLYESLLGRSRAADVARFEREAQLLATIRHPRVVRYVAHGEVEGGRPFLAMEWLEGEDLGQRLEREPLRLHEAIVVARRVAEALSALHDMHVVHRDIKPSNIFLPHGSADQAKVLDLGVARLVRATRPSTRSGIMVGTPGYMAPEQARGSKEIDPRADVFSLGCVLWECLVGRPAFAGDNIAALLAKILIETPPILADVGVDVPPALQDLVRRMLVKAPSGRPADGRAVLGALEAFADLDAPAAARDRASVSVQRALTAGERRLVCVVMASPAALPVEEGSTDDLETMEAFDPKAIAAVYGGELETLADGSFVVALGAKGSASDQAAHAARCALELRTHLVDADVVLATGLATMDGPSAVGDVIERAAALLAQARDARGGGGTSDTVHGPRPILLDETTAGLLDMRFDVGGDARGLFIRGLRDRESPARTLLGKPTPFVGRDRELGALTALLDECNDESVARVALVIGFPGSGKSRLVGELLAWVKAQAPQTETWIARGEAMSEGSPFALVARLLRRASGIGGGEPLVVRQQKLRARVARNVAEADVARVAEFLGEAASIPFDAGTSVQLRAARQDPILMGDQIRRAFSDLVVAEATAGTLLVVIEDLHWGDLPSVNLLDAALRSAQDRRFMVLAVGRGEVHEAFPQLWAQRSPQEIRLGPLVRRAGEKLVREVLGASLPAADVARLLDRAAGNPFYLEELIRAYVEQSSVRPPSGILDPRAAMRAPGQSLPPEPPGWSRAGVEGPDAAWALPSTVLAMVEARLRRLDPMARRVLRAASIFGERFWRGGVLALTGGQYKGSELDEWLNELSRREIVQKRDVSRFPKDDEYVFRHAIVRDAAYQMLTPDDLALGHRLAGGWLEEAGEEEPMRLGEHFERGGAMDRAATFYGRAALQSLDGNDFIVAKLRAERAIGAGATGEALGSLHLLLAEASRWSGEHEAAREHANVALRELRAGSDDAYVAAAEAVEAAITLGHVDEASLVAERVRAIVAPTITTPRVVATTRIAIALGVVGSYAPAIALLAPFDRDASPGENALEVLGTDDAARAFLLAARVARSSWEGDNEQTALRAQEAALCFDVLGDQRNAARQRLAAGWALTEMGAYTAAEAVLGSARADAERLGLPAVANDAKLCLSYVLARTARFDAAKAVAGEVVEVFSGQRDRVGEGRARAYLSGVHYFGGELALALAEERRALPLLEHSRPHRAALLGFTTLIRLHAGEPPETVHAAAAEAMRLLEEIGGVAEGEALIRLSWAEGLAAIGDMDGARLAIAAARDRLLARAARIRNPEYKRAFLGVVREHVRTLARAGEWLA